LTLSSTAPLEGFRQKLACMR